MQRKIKIDASKVIATPNPRMWGLFFEEINHAGEGGLYAELIRNRNFSESNIPEGTIISGTTVLTVTGHKETFNPEPPLPGWKLHVSPGGDAVMSKITDNPRNPNCPEQLRLSVIGGKATLYNSGFWGFSVCKSGYRGFVIARSNGIGEITVGLARSSGAVLTSAKISGITDTFAKFPFELDGITATDARFFIAVDSPGTLYLDFVSMFPKDTYKGRENGLRRDLAEMLEGLKPGFVRFPGGCVVEGINMQNAYHWKKTIGPIEDRPGHWSLWGYRWSDGMGYHEYLQLCEDLGADALYVCNCGMSCQYRRGEFAHGDDIDVWVEDALDAIEYALGDTSTKWGAERAKNGHPEPFPLKYVEIGNENWGEEYFKRYRKFYEAIKAKWPQVILIADCRVPDAPMDMVDDHYYTAPPAMPLMYNKYENAPKDLPVYVGEYACNADVGYGNLISAISEACFMVGMERAADVVRMASYAPLFCHVNDRKWPVNLINFDRDHVFGLPSYFVQKMFAESLPERVVYADCENAVQNGDGLYVTAGIKGDSLILKVACYSAKDLTATLEIDGVKTECTADVALLSGDSPEATNSLLYPEEVSPAYYTIDCGCGSELTFPAYSLTILTFKIKK